MDKHRKDSTVKLMEEE